MNLIENREKIVFEGLRRMAIRRKLKKRKLELLTEVVSINKKLDILDKLEYEAKQALKRDLKE